MRTVVNRRFMLAAAALLVLGGIALGLAGALKPASEVSDARCNERLSENEAILKCVAREAAAARATPASVTAAITGAAALIAGLILGIRAIHRVMTLHEAAKELQLPIEEVRLWVSRGKLNPVSIPGAQQLYIDPEEVHRLSAVGIQTQVAAQRPTEAG